MKKVYALSLALASFGTALAQNNVSTGTTKYVLLEEGTGTWCQYCPDGQVVMMQILANSANQNRVVAVALHDGDAMAVPAINTMIDTYLPNWPNGGVDRVLNTTSNKVFMSRGSWQQYVTQQLAVAPGFQVDILHDYNNTTRALTVTVRAKALTAQTGDYNINCYIVEDSVTGTGSGYNQINAYNNTAGHPFYQAGNPIVGFVHRHVARATLGGSWGTTGVIATNPPANGTYAKTYSYTLPGTTNYSRFKIVAFVTKHDATTPNNRIVKNSMEAHVTPGSGNTLAVSEVVNNISEVTIFPNPASEEVFVNGIITETSDVNISITNSVGQIVAAKNISKVSGELNTSMQLEELSGGLYFITITTNNSKKTERLVINR
ncbi:MAG: Omp28-related outer membrane protein [Flavipsychrobacter sp.]|nr:Omp28-related outer membrane protein [Flavipsychrobacter sp.]